MGLRSDIALGSAPCFVLQSHPPWGGGGPGPGTGPARPV